MQMSDSVEEIMQATYRALVESGYAELSISDIADNFEGSQSLIYYHYESKDELLVEFLDHLLDELDEELETIDSKSPTERFRSIVDLLLPASTDVEAFAFQQALLEIRVQTPYHEPYAERFERLDEELLTLFRETIAAIQEDSDDSISTNRMADRLLTEFYGGHYRHVPVADTDAIHSAQDRLEEKIAEWEDQV
jgi:AcrR family transcriptional regulator